MNAIIWLAWWWLNNTIAKNLVNKPRHNMENSNEFIDQRENWLLSTVSVLRQDPNLRTKSHLLIENFPFNSADEAFANPENGSKTNNIDQQILIRSAFNFAWHFPIVNLSRRATAN